MPWEKDPVSLKLEFVMLATQPGANVSELCGRFEISREAGYRAIRAYRGEGAAGLKPRSRRPKRSPTRTPPEMEALVLALRDAHPAWGGRKIHRRLTNLGHTQVPAPSTVTGILHRNGRIDPEAPASQGPWKRFEHAAPNDLWQMDHKGNFALEAGRCHPLTVLDDHSRFSIALRASGDERRETVRTHLIKAFRRYGLPRGMLMDNGSPWGSDADHPWTWLTVWLLRLGIGVFHGAPYHPQTQGKDERFHRTLKAEVLRWERFRDLAHCQRCFDLWRDVYNLERPHEGIGMAVPASRYAPSPRAFPEIPPPIEYGPGDTVRKVGDGGLLSFRGRPWRVGKAFKGYPVALRPTHTDGLFEVVFRRYTIHQIDLRKPDGVA